MSFTDIGKNQSNREKRRKIESQKGQQRTQYIKEYVSETEGENNNKEIIKMRSQGTNTVNKKSKMIQTTQANIRRN